MSKQLPQWKCHKVVRAAQIIGYGPAGNLDVPGSVQLNLAGGIIIFVNAKWLEKHYPEEGPFILGYFVEYEDGYTSFSPEKAFEDGYSRVEKGDAS